MRVCDACRCNGILRTIRVDHTEGSRSQPMTYSAARDLCNNCRRLLAHLLVSWTPGLTVTLIPVQGTPSSVMLGQGGEQR